MTACMGRTWDMIEQADRDQLRVTCTDDARFLFTFTDAPDTGHGPATTPLCGGCLLAVVLVVQSGAIGDEPFSVVPL